MNTPVRLTGHDRARRTAIVSVMALIILVMFATLGIAMAINTDINLAQANNQATVQSALFQAESGLSFFCYILKQCTPPNDAFGQDLLDEIADHLGSSAEILGNLDGAAVYYDNQTITISNISLADGGSFSAEVSLAGETTVVLDVTGQDGNVTRSIGLDLTVTPESRMGAFAYGVATKGTVKLKGSASLDANDPSQANIYTSYSGDQNVLTISGNASLAGDLYASNPQATTDGVALDRIHTGSDPVEFPEPDMTAFAPFLQEDPLTAMNESTSSDDHNNIIIPSGTNPTFTGGTISGVIYIEAGNHVTFAGGTAINAVIITEDAGDSAGENNTITFLGNTTAQGAVDLPDGFPDMTGTFLIAPGFNVGFTGNFGAIVGAMAAENFTFSGSSEGTVNGSIVNYGDTEMLMDGHSTFFIDRTDVSGIPPGFTPLPPAPLTPVASTHVEY